METVIHCFHPEARLPEGLEALAPLYRSVLSQAGRVLLLLDNAAGSEQIRPLVPPANCLLLATSREHINLPGLAPRHIDCLTADKARELLLALAPRIGAQADDAAALCGRLPLALEVFAGAVNDKSLTPVPELLERLKRGQDHLAPVEAAFEVSAGLLEEGLRRRWTWLAAFAADFDLPAASAVWDEKDEAAARESMQALVNASLVEWNEPTGRFRLHDLVRRFCDGRMPQEDREAVWSRHAAHYCDLASRADDLYEQGGEAVLLGLEVLDRERTHIEAAFDWLAARGDRASAALLVRLVDAVAYTSDLRFHPSQRIRWFECQRDAARAIGDRQAQGAALGNLGLAHAALGDARKAIEFHEQALAITRQTGDRRGEDATLGNLGSAYGALGDARKAIEFCKQALAIAREIGDRHGEGATLGNLGNAHADLGDVRKAIEFFEQHLTIARKIGDRRGEGSALGNLGNAYQHLGDARKAIEFYEQALAIAREIGDRRGEGSALGNLGNAYARLGDARKAIEFYEQALAIHREMGDRRGEGNALGNLGNAYQHLGDARKAIGFYEQVLTILREIGDRRGEGQDLWNSALAFDKLGNRAEAVSRAEAAMQIFEAIEDPNAAMVRTALARWRGRKGE